MREVSNATHEEKHDLLREDGPPEDIYWKAVPIWCGQSHDDLAERLGEEYGCGYALGFEEGVVMSMLRPEWAQGLYHSLRQHYLTTHTEEDLEDWERHADETTRVLPVALVSAWAGRSRWSKKTAPPAPRHAVSNVSVTSGRVS